MLGLKFSNPEKPSSIEKLLGGPIKQKLALGAEAVSYTHLTLPTSDLV